MYVPEIMKKTPAVSTKRIRNPAKAGPATRVKFMLELLREMALLKVVASDSQLKRAKKLCQKYKYTVLDKTTKSFVFEVSAMKKEIDVLIKKLQPLGLASATDTSATTSNYFSENCYNALFNACMIEANYFIKDFQVVQSWEAKYKNSIDALRNQARRTRQDDMQSANSPTGGPNPVIQGAN